MRCAQGDLTNLTSRGLPPGTQAKVIATACQGHANISCHQSSCRHFLTDRVVICSTCAVGTMPHNGAYILSVVSQQSQACRQRPEDGCVRESTPYLDTRPQGGPEDAKQVINACGALGATLSGSNSESSLSIPRLSNTPTSPLSSCKLQQQGLKGSTRLKRSI